MKTKFKIPPITALIFFFLLTIGLAVVGLITMPAAQRPGVEEAIAGISDMLKLGSVTFPHKNTPLYLARFCGGMFAGLAMWMVWNKIFREETTRWRLRFWNGHVVICGLGCKGLRLALDYREAGERVVVLSNAITADEERACRDAGILVVRGDATHAETLALLRPEHARTVIACCAADETNLDVGMQSMQRHRDAESGGTLTCHCHVASLPLRDALQRALVSRPESGFDLRFFNSHEITARELLASHPLECDAPDIAAADARPVRLVLFGSTPAAEAMLLQAARMAHHLNLEPLRVTLLERAPARSEAMIERHPGLRHCCVITQAALPSQPTPSGTAAVIPDDDSERRTAVIALEEDARNVEFALALASLPENKIARVAARVADRVGLLRLLDHSGGHLAGRRVHVFGGAASACTRAMIETAPQDALAAGIHDNYFETQIHAGVQRGSTPAMVPWSQLPEEFRVANRANADHIDTKLRAMGYKRVPLNSEGQPVEEFTNRELDQLAPVEHNRWNAERWISGWQHGGVRDDSRKLHPSLKPWSELSETERDKDRSAIRCLSALLRTLGWKVVRL